MNDAPPIRASVDDIRAGKLSEEDASRLEISCNGEVQEKVVSYDCEVGTVTKHLVDDEGRAQLTPDREEVAKVTVTGHVIARWKDAGR